MPWSVHSRPRLSWQPRSCVSAVAAAGPGTRCARDSQGSGCSSGQCSTSGGCSVPRGVPVFAPECSLTAARSQLGCGSVVTASEQSLQRCTCGHTGGRELAGHDLPPLGQPLLSPQGTQGPLQPHTEPWPELPSLPITSPVCCSKLSQLLGHVPQPLGLLKPLAASSAQTHPLQRGVRGDGHPPCPQGHFGECLESAAMGQGWHWSHQASWCPMPAWHGGEGSCGLWDPAA